ncbi:Asp-tRNA(Asn)/Glu-tRNA(Gln) amidotransferase subunit GatA [Patescibacteria group bacterium]|nr:Asp-tRNA(Asn)/Glu-tRNA(Gln) amidotransferase subunit GatA [Patescibacteria group bacterium]MBU1500496.1 Asp-tRNA(Asn)/Glu-tRNA(Gln) amidotransferase subunit GatA [Patescibacteria group bacterium]MBU2080705.1 Asp-tRNA(Asn)/Glu-tRNA(Gln) amidotransferase subunit GatA [Patescibacteria group bacterium]MBU2123810.1 Asp-tRNA(Asn)/Glu-tRNA(Gln) amidotransferase subunit GatA [Patescibacteria group bacterium]MBU2194899.1 Asp-tRNA(Asn)/Glu-tRNA(Gln) amidotransferase subunit GatA [Patescibacteria group
MTKALNELSITEAARGLRAGEFSVRELWDACVSVAKERNTELNAYLEIFEADEEAMAVAQKRIDTEKDAAPLLCGIPLAMKDNILIEGKVASAASRMLENHVAVRDATITKKLKEAGALFIGRTNMDEFAMGSSTEHSAYGVAKNPLDVSRTAGGSSGGSASAVAAHIGLAGLGTDTGGSIRQPAAHTGLVGMKPTYGAVSRSGLIALGSSLDQAGPLAKTVADAKILFDTLEGKDELDATTLPDSMRNTKEVPSVFRIGVPRDLLSKGMDADVLAHFNETLSRLEAEGHTLVDVSLPTSEYALPVYYVIMPAEASANLARFDGIRYGHAARGETLLSDYVLSKTEGFGPETVRRILLGTFVLSSGYIDAYYRKADAVRDVLRDEYNTAFKEVDVIAFPTTPSPAFKFGEKSDPVSMYLEDIFTVTANLTGMPAISVPMGTVEREGVLLPTGMHFTAPHGADQLLFKIGALVTKETL